MLNMKHITIYLSLIVALLLSVSSCKRKVELREIQPVEVKVQVIDTLEQGYVTTYVGEVEENLSVALNFPTGGTVQKLAVREGDRVREGQLLATVDNSTAQNAYNAAKASLQQAEDAYKRLKKVYEQGSVAEVKWVEMETNLEKARSMEQIARKQLDDCTLYAPFSGVVGRCNAEAGSNVLPHETVLTLLDMKQVFVTFSVPESEIPSVAVGDRVQVKVPVLNEKVMDGRVAERSVKSNRLSHSYQFKVALSNPSSDLLPGMVSKVYLAQKNIRGYIIPAKAVQTRPEGQSIWVVRNGQAVRRPIGASEFAGNGILITDGLNYGDTVIVGGCQKLYDNAKLIIHQ